MTQDTDMVLGVLHALEGVVELKGGEVLLTFQANEKEANEEDDEPELFKFAEKFDQQTRGQESERIEALVGAMAWIRQTGGSTMESMVNAFRQGTADVGGRDVRAPETSSMLFAVATIIEILLAKANVSNVSRLAVLGSIVARELNRQNERTRVFNEAVDEFRDGGNGYGSAPWYQDGEKTEKHQKAGGVVSRWGGPLQAELEAGLVRDLEKCKKAENESETKTEKRRDAYLDARQAWRDADEEWRRDRALRIWTSNELELVRGKRRRTTAR